MDAGYAEKTMTTADGTTAGRRSAGRPTRAGLCFLTLLMMGCSERGRGLRSVDAWWQGGPPDDPPRVLNASMPFQYPVQQYLRRVQGNVTLRLFVDSAGQVVSDSTRIEAPSGVAAFDSAALAGADKLRFRPARRHGVAIPVAMLFPVHFRHPEGPRLPGDSLP
jgi:TonB family protein